jgi:hypothetical protein
MLNKLKNYIVSKKENKEIIQEAEVKMPTLETLSPFSQVTNKYLAEKKKHYKKQTSQSYQKCFTQKQNKLEHNNSQQW